MVAEGRAGIYRDDRSSFDSARAADIVPAAAGLGGDEFALPLDVFGLARVWIAHGAGS